MAKPPPARSLNSKHFHFPSVFTLLLSQPSETTAIFVRPPLLLHRSLCAWPAARSSLPPRSSSPALSAHCLTSSPVSPLPSPCSPAPLFPGAQAVYVLRQCGLTPPSPQSFADSDDFEPTEPPSPHRSIDAISSPQPCLAQPAVSSPQVCLSSSAACASEASKVRCPSPHFYTVPFSPPANDAASRL